ncbi:non-homologous end-joining DNA ligase LigD [Saccharopolyspora sp. NPDC002376]
MLDHYRAVAEVMVARTSGKPLTLRRFSDGIDEGGFFQRDGHHPRNAVSAVVHHVVLDDPAILLYLAGQARLEFHIGLATVDDLERPVLVVLDLDPPDGVSLTVLREVVRQRCVRLRDAGLEPHVQATGGRGFHIAAPLRAEHEFDDVRADLQELAERAVRDEPDRLTVEQRKDKRGGRIFLDTNRNAYGQTMIAPYSLRARPGAPAAAGPRRAQPCDTAVLRPREHGAAARAEERSVGGNAAQVTWVGLVNRP